MTITRIITETYEINEEKLNELIRRSIETELNFFIRFGSDKYDLTEAVCHRTIMDYRVWHDKTYHQYIPSYKSVLLPIREYINKQLTTAELKGEH